MKASSSRYRTIHCKIWNDDKFPFLSSEGKLVFFLLLTTTFSTPFGAYKAGKAALEEESRMDAKGFAKGFGECLSVGLAKYDETTRTVFIPNFMRHNQPANPNVVKNWSRMFNELPDSEIKPEIYRAILECCEGLGKGYAEGFRESFVEPAAKGSRIQEQEQEQEQEQNIGIPSGIPCRAADAAATQCDPVPGKKPDQIPYAEIVSHLNGRCGCQYQPTSQATRRAIKARWAEGFRLDDFKLVIDHKHADWSQDAKMCAFLRPETLFSPKFEGYLQAAKNSDGKPLNGAPLPPEQDELLQKVKAARAERERKMALQQQQGGQHV